MQALTSDRAATRMAVVAAHRPQGTMLTKPHLEAWLRQAAPGDRIPYHQGHLALDRVRSSSRLPEPARRELVAVATVALALAERGEIHLVQQRLELGAFRYIAVKGHPDQGRGTSG